MEGPRIYTLDPNWASFELGAFLLALLAYPDPDEFDALSDAADALCAQKIAATCQAYAEAAAAWREAYPVYAALSAEEIRRRLKPLKRRFRDRMLAARMALGWLEEGLTGNVAKLPASMERHSLEELAKLVAVQVSHADPHLVKRRQWRASLPVIHLAAALQVVMRLLEPGPDDFGYDIEDERLHRAVIGIARVHERIVREDKRFGRTRLDRLISVDWPEKFAA